MTLPKRVKHFLILTLFLVLPLLLYGCTIPIINLTIGEKQSGKVTLKYWGLWEPKEVMQPLIDKYQKQNPNVAIVYEQRSPVQYRENLQAKIQKNEGPDIFRFHNTWTGMIKDVFSPLPKAVMDDPTYKNSFYPVVTEDLRLGKNYIGIPLEYDGLALYWNRALFRAAGIAGPPQNWDELRKVAAQLTVRDEAGRISTSGVALGTATNVDHFQDILGVMMLQNGVDLAKIDTSIDVKGRNLGADALDFYVLFAKDQNRVWDDTLEPSTLAFAKGKLAMYFGPSWRAFQFKEANPALEFATAPVPQLPGFKVSWASYWVEGVSARSKHQRQAWDFLRFLSSKENLQDLYAQSSRLRLFGEPYPRVDMTSLLSPDPLVGAYLVDAPHARSFPVASRTFDNGLNDKLSQFLEDAVTTTLKGGGGSPEALTTARKGFDQVLTQFGLLAPPKTK